MRQAINVTAFIFLALLMSHAVYALGVSPGKATLHYSPSLTETIEVDVHNNQHKEFTGVIYVEGELKEYITLSKDEIHFNEDQSIKSFSYTVKLPEEIGKVGILVGEINIVEKLASDSEVNLNMKSKVGVKTKLYLNIPYPGKYAEAEFKVDEVKDEDEDVNFFISVFNLGTDNIGKYFATVEIYNPEGTLIKTITTEPKSIPSKQKGELIISLPQSELPLGDYTAKAVLNYDENTLVLPEKPFKLKGSFINLLSVMVDEYSLGNIAKFTFLLKNVGNRLVEDVYSRMILNKGDEVVANIKSYSVDMEKEETTETVAFWDTKNIDIGEYYGKIHLNYEDEKFDKDVRVQLSQDKIDVEVIGGITGQATTDTGMANYADNSLIKISLVIIIALLVTILIFVKRNMKKS